MYNLALFVHLLGVALLVAAMTTTLVATLRAQTAATVQDLRSVTAVTRKIDLAIGPAMLLILSGGLYMVARGGDDGGISWTSGWVDVALVIFAVMTALGPTVESGHAKRLQSAAAQLPDGPVPAELDRLRRDATALYVSFFGASQILAFLYLMTNKPGLVGSLVACAVAAVASAAASSRRLRSLSSRSSGPAGDVPAPLADPGVAPTP